MVTWNRILAGRWKDAQVGAHILIGAATGVLIWVGAGLTDVFFGSRQAGVEGGLEAALGTRRWLATHIGTLGNVMIVGFALFLVIFGIRRLVKKNLLAAIVASALLVVFNNPAQLAEHWQTFVPVYFVMFAILIFVLLRLGLVALFAEIFFGQQLREDRRGFGLDHLVCTLRPGDPCAAVGSCGVRLPAISRAARVAGDRRS